VIASVRGIVILAVVGALLLLAVVFDHERAALDRAVVPGFDPAKVRALTWAVPATKQQVAVVRRGAGWMIDDVPVEGRVVDDLLGSLRAARWHRRAHERGLRAHRTLAIEMVGGSHVIELGEGLEGGEQTWIRVDGGDPLLVDGWLAALLDPDPLAFRDRAPLANAANATAINVDEASGRAVELHGPPWRSRDGLITPALGDQLAATLGALRIVALADPHASPALATVAIDVAGAPRVRVGGPCAAPDQTAIFVGELPPGCLATAAWTDALAAITSVSRPAADTIDRRPAGFAIDRIELPGGVLHVAHVQVDLGTVTHHADPDRVADLLRALAEPGEPVAIPASAPAFALTLVPVRGEPVVLDLFADAVHRRGERLALRVAPASRAVLARPAAELLDTERWAEEPSTITTLVLDGVTYRRGAVLGEWTREPVAAFDPALVEAVASTVAKVHAPVAGAATPVAHHLAVTFAPPVGTPLTHTIELGPQCTGKIDGEGTRLPLALCTTVAALAAR